MAVAPSNNAGRLGRRAVLGSACLPLVNVSRAFARASMPTVGFISLLGKDDTAGALYRDSILEGLAQHGLTPDRTMRWLDRYADYSRDRVAALVAELMSAKAEVILSIGASTIATLAATNGQVPVVYGYSGDPIAAGLADSLAHPRGNATGVTIMAVETNAKRVEILKEIVPEVRRIALIASPNHPGEAGELEVCRRTVASIGVDLLYMPVFSTADVDKALHKAADAGADALMALPDGITTQKRDSIAWDAVARRVPSGSGWPFFADNGFLMTFGPDPRECYRRVGQLAARVLDGAAPVDLPIEQPTRFVLVVNKRTARAIGITIPESVLARADRVIE